MAELVIGPLVTMVKDKASSYLLDQYKVMDGMEEQRKILERQLPAILDVIEDAEDKGASRPGVRAWLGALKTVAYEAIDVFDEFKYEALRRDAKKKGHYKKLGMDIVSLFPARNPIVFRYRMGKKLRRIVQTIEVLVAEMNTFGFIHRQQAPPSNDWRKTDPIMLESEEDIVKRSRHEEKVKIVKILLDQTCDSDLRVLPIVGMGGLGKTTFAQLIYNDPEIKKHFELQRWCCVSDDFDVVNIANVICKTTVKDREKALQNLQKEVSGKRYLIVLDDVWNRDADKWGKLKTCLKQGGKGSTILTTTRDAEVARVMSMGIVEAHNLENLADEYLKEMIQSRAFSLQKPNSDELDGIVDKIVERCAGSPLAAKAFGSMLSTKISVQEWKAILDRANICNDKTGILPILKLSYDDLPPHMKRCFALCAVFPKDYEIDVETLIRLWMAHDFIPLQEEVHLETLGEEIFNQLAWRSFFQDVKQTPLEYEYREQLCNRTICKIHDLMHDIALSVMGKECLTITDRPNQKTLSLNSTRHLFSSYSEIGTHLDDFLKKQSPSLRTLLYPDGSTPHLPKYNSLRALQVIARKELPVRPKHLQHLRYLSLSGSSMIEELPEEISLLYNLQTLDLSGCRRLGRLPNDMKYMTSLRHVYTNGCKSLKCMPPDLGHLTSLQTLTYFVVGASSGCSTVRELQNLNLGGELELCCLENVIEAHAKAASLINKKKLTHLSLEWSDHGRVEPVSDCHKKVLDALRPHDGLQMLRIVSYKSTSLPIWTTDLGVLSELHLVGCTTCEEFPHFWHLKALQVLYLISLDKMQSLCSDTTCTAFPALKELRLHGLWGLEKWVATEGTTQELTFPLLEKLDIMYCPKLTTLPEAPKLKVVELREEEAQLSLSIVRSRYMPLLSRLRLRVGGMLGLCVRDRGATPTLQLDWNHEASLTFLGLEGCSFFFPSSPSQPTIGIWKWFRQLVDLRITDCDALIYWPEEEFRCLVSLKKLDIEFCGNLIGPTQTQVKGDPTRARDQLLPHLTSLYIRDCERLTELFILPPSLTHIDIGGCSIPSFASSEHCNDHDNSLSSLKWLSISSCDKLRSVSGQLDALEHLSIGGCDTLESLECLGDLPSLQNLNIYSCDKLRSVSGQLPSLQILSINRCKRLASLSAGLWSSAGLREIAIEYCPDLNMKPLYESLERLNGLEHKDLSHARSSNPWEGPKLRDPKSWKYAIPQFRDY